VKTLQPSEVQDRIPRENRAIVYLNYGQGLAGEKVRTEIMTRRDGWGRGRERDWGKARGK